MELSSASILFFIQNLIPKFPPSSPFNLIHPLINFFPFPYENTGTSIIPLWKEENVIQGVEKENGKFAEILGNKFLPIHII